MGAGSSDTRGDGRARVLAAVRAQDGEITVSELAALVRLHPNTVRFHLDRLVTGGQVELHGQEDSRGGRPPLTYRAVDGSP
ncbi:MAG TPA: helix-turn-helix domain-containing protein [Nocardioidaceae bacterium]|nr:helix-turn-helix domain-containing protein [Nocardioidaceae bacterium]